MNFQKSKLFALCLLSFFVAARAGAAQPGAHLPLWKIEGPTNQVFLLGSLHLLSETNYPLAAPITAAYTNAAVVVFEADVAEMNKPEVQMKLMLKGQLPAGETLSNHLSPELFAQFNQSLKKLGLPPEMFLQFKPSIAAVTLSVLELQKLKFDLEKGIDQHFSKLAVADGKKIVPLETLEFQMNLITDVSKEEGELLMKSTLKDIDKVRSMYAEMLKAWQTGDDRALEKLLNDSMSEYPALAKRMLTDRNERWVPIIQDLVRGGKNVLVVVGAGHLVGDQGVVELLKKKGLKVRQL